MPSNASFERCNFWGFLPMLTCNICSITLCISLCSENLISKLILFLVNYLLYSHDHHFPRWWQHIPLNWYYTRRISEVRSLFALYFDTLEGHTCLRWNSIRWCMMISSDILGHLHPSSTPPISYGHRWWARHLHRRKSLRLALHRQSHHQNIIFSSFCGQPYFSSAFSPLLIYNSI